MSNFLNVKNVVFPSRFELTVGSAEYEEVIKCFQTENKVLFKRKDESSDSQAKHNGFQVENLEVNAMKPSEDESESFATASRQKSKANQSRLSRPNHTIPAQGWVMQNGRYSHRCGYSSPNYHLSSFGNLSIERKKISVETALSPKKEDIVTPRRKIRSNSTPNISDEILKYLNKGKSQLRRNSASETFSSVRKPKSKSSSASIDETICDKSHAGFANKNCCGHLASLGDKEKKFGIEDANQTVRNQSTRNRRASLPSRVNTASGRWSSISPRIPTEKMNKTCFDPDLSSKKNFPRRNSGPETYITSVANDAPSSLKYSKMRRFSLPTSCSKTSEKFPGIMRTTSNKQPSPESPVDLRKDISLEHVLRLWNVRLPKQLTNDLKTELEYKSS